MKKILVGAILALAIVFIFKTCSSGANERSALEESSMLLQQEISNVSKLIVTEGHFSEVYNYKDSQKLFGDYITADKKALVVVNAEVVIAYDLAKIEFEVDPKTKTLQINNIPEPEIKMNPDFEYYDITADYLNPFDASDYNKIKKNVKASLLKKIEASTLKSNSRNRLVSELSKFLILTNSMGWTLVYEGKKIENIKALNIVTDTVLDYD